MDDDMKDDVNNAIDVFRDVCCLYNRTCDECPLYSVNACGGGGLSNDQAPVYWDNIE